MIAPSTSSMETQAKLVVESPFSNLSSSIVSTLDNSLKQFSHRSSLRFQTLATRRRISLSAAATTPGPSPIQDEHRKPPDLQTLMRRFWKVAVPYWSSDDKVQARLQLAAVFALTLGTTGITVGFSFLGRDFYNALANKDQQQFTKQLLYYLAGFAGGIPFFVLRDYAREKLSLRWRSWMTSYYMDRYLKNKTFYKIQSQSTIDNPDQRIVDDLSSFTGTALSFSLTLFNAAIDLISFSNILYGIFPPLFVVLLAYSLGGTAISIFLGRGLVNLNFLQEKKEADFRYGLVRVRENAESIAFYGGEENEMQLLLTRFRSAFENLNQLLISSRNLEFFTNGYRYLIQILPAAVVAPMYFSGKVEFGVINQSVSAFNHILGDFSLIVYQFQAISAFSAVIDRLGEFDDVLDSSNGKGHRDSKEEIQLSFCLISCSNGLDSNGSMPLSKRVKLLHVEHLTVQTPSEATLIKDLSFEIFEKDHLLVTGPSGSGKTSLLRAVAGLWSFGNGAITVYVRAGGDLDIPHSADVVSHQVASINETVGNSTGRRNSEGVIFLPQKPYMVLGTLRQQLLYPIWTEDPDNLSDGAKQSDSLPFLTHARDARCVNEKPKKPTSDDLIQVLNDVSLGHLLSRFDGLDSTHEWSSVLSLGEQQRLAFGRLLLSKPTLALLDESTSALDEANEARLYQLIQAAGITYISIGHRRTLYKYHKKVLHVYTADRTTAQHNWSFKDVEEDPKYNFSWQ
ncbi:ABC transporter D family member 2, chloroplastic [Capsicum annuum]|uniref:ABC transporter D family member 2, chloroplastic n=1 Tax=Capsicum annuum TaxID=4072 RepID=A0A1U8G1H0_CAPAN|nr:ABC transporter D family member 2, chloroplastic isoform X1 [Capsicum annuum]KAF3646532.1 ABC transporter D family member 2, chloroplastic [Capsicum annuum]KAF3661533.1 ABC transporter D family member 2, chloroplastic [Capsicum annuum]PHT86844.1 ABC transporter D family member 2, chloroplastic [Capsicum annuum]